RASSEVGAPHVPPRHRPPSISQTRAGSSGPSPLVYERRSSPKAPPGQGGHGGTDPTPDRGRESPLPRSRAGYFARGGRGAAARQKGPAWPLTPPFPDRPSSLVDSSWEAG